MPPVRHRALGSAVIREGSLFLGVLGGLYHSVCYVHHHLDITRYSMFVMSKLICNQRA